jgi:hypothetical protein
VVITESCQIVIEDGSGYSDYTWIVTRDTILGDSSEAVGKIGPSGVSNRAPFDSVIIHGEHFRMLNAAGEVQFSGYILGQYQGSEPLDDYGAENGCAFIEFEHEGNWVSLAEFQSRIRPGAAPT